MNNSSSKAARCKSRMVLSSLFVVGLSSAIILSLIELSFGLNTSLRALVCYGMLGALMAQVADLTSIGCEYYDLKYPNTKEN